MHAPRCFNASPFPLPRETMKDLAERLLDPIPVLDHGFVRLVDCMPRWVEGEETADHAITQAARVSYQKGTTAKRSDRGLIRYLMRHWHTSPFEMVDLKFHVKMPIFVARQWVRHRTASINEISARYSILPEETYQPEPEHLRPQSRTNKQGRADAELDPDLRAQSLTEMDEAARRDFATYRELLERDVARESARSVLPVSTYTEWYWKANLLNVLRFLQLRMDPHAQYEIRVYAEEMAKMVATIAPWTYEAFQDYWIGGERFSAQEWAAMRSVLGPEELERVAAALEGELSAGELREFRARMKTP